MGLREPVCVVERDCVSVPEADRLAMLAEAAPDDENEARMEMVREPEAQYVGTAVADSDAQTLTLRVTERVCESVTDAVSQPLGVLVKGAVVATAVRDALDEAHDDAALDGERAGLPDMERDADEQ